MKVSTKILEGEKERIQMFQGLVIKVQNKGNSSNFTVRRVVQGVGVEKTFPFKSPLVEKVEVTRHGKVRRAKLFYLRGLSTKASRLKEKRFDKELVEKVAPAEEAVEVAPVAEAAPAATPEAVKKPETDKKA